MKRHLRGRTAPEKRPISDKARLVWLEFIGPAQAAQAHQQQALATAQDITARHMMAVDGVNVEDGWQFNVATLEYERHPNKG